MNESPDAFDDGDTEALADAFENFRQRFDQLRSQVRRAIVGQEQMVDDCLVAMFSQGHVLLEGVPGLGKTFLVRVLSRVLGLSFGRVQCTPDLMPADILGTHIVSENDAGRRELRFERGPVFCHLLLVDEINRATPKTQAAMLEAMQERTVTSGGERHELPAPFFVLATQNPLEMEGTYPLPEAQLDRFMFKLKVPFPNAAELVDISRRTTGPDEIELETVLGGDEFAAIQQTLTRVPIADPLLHYAAAIILASHPGTDHAGDRINRFVSYGASPRGLQALVRGARALCVLDGRTAVSLDDIHAVALPALRHRVVMNFDGQAEAINSDDLVAEIIASVPTPAEPAAAAAMS